MNEQIKKGLQGRFGPLGFCIRVIKFIVALCYALQIELGEAVDGVLDGLISLRPYHLAGKLLRTGWRPSRAAKDPTGYEEEVDVLSRTRAGDCNETAAFIDEVVSDAKRIASKSKQFTTSEIAAKSGIAHRDGNEVWVLCVAEIDYDNQEQTVSLFIGPCAAIDGRFDDINKQAAAICEKDPAAGRSIWRCFHDRSG